MTIEVQTRVPPHDREAERLVIGGLLIDNGLIPVVGESITEKSFDFAAHRDIYAAILDLFERDFPVDLVTLKDELTRRQKLDRVGGMAYISGLLADVSAITNVRHYASIISDKFLLRRLITACNRIIDRCYDGAQDAMDALEYAERSVSDVAQNRSRTSVVPLGDIVEDNLDTIEKLATGEKKVSGVPTGFKDLDALILGFHPGDEIIIGSRPSVGKTSLCLNMAQNMTKRDKVPILIFTIEMSKEEITNRLISSVAGVSLLKIRSGKLSHKDREAIKAACDEIGELPIFIDDSATLTPLQMRSRAKMLKAEHNIGVVMIDYLQLMQYHRRTDNRQQEVTAISRSLKAMARELDVAVVAFSQLSRDVTKRRENNIPQLADLRESGSLEQDADVVLFLHDPSRSVYKKKEEGQKRPEAVEIEVIVAKQRNGPVGSIKLLFQTKFATFRSISNEPAPPWDAGDDSDGPDWISQDDDDDDLDYE
ncbi:MAG: replicative DNA helicase [Candidatus Coatesbacteria bacterium]|nr:replicative DNA helicase [Candidatus Coatesbacteria bacterium]